MQTLRHTAAFESAAKGMSEEELMAALEMIARNPKRGDIIRGTGGVRKMRVPLSGRGKSGGARVIYYYLDRRNPIYLLFTYAKNVRDDLSDSQRNDMARIVAVIKAELRERRTR